MKKNPNQKIVGDVQNQLNELAEVAESAVVGYEKYLLDEINYNDLARIMTNLRSYLPKGITGSKK